MKNKTTWYLLSGIVLFAIIVLVAYLSTESIFAIFINGLVAIGTLALALVTFLTLRDNQKARDENNRIRTVNETMLELEQICDWAQKAVKALTPSGEQSSIFLMQMQDELPELAAKSLSIEYGLMSLPDSGELQKEVSSAANLLDGFIDFMALKKQSITLEKEYEPKRDVLKKCFEDVVETASNLKEILKIKSKRDFPIR